MPETNAIAIDVAEAIKTKVAAVSGASGAVVDLVPDFGLEQVTDLRILVTPHSEADSNKGAADRSAVDLEVQTDIAIMERLTGKGEIPAKIKFCEDIKNALQRQVLANGLGINQLASISPLYDVRIFKSMKVFLSVIVVTTKVLKR